MKINHVALNHNSTGDHTLNLQLVWDNTHTIQQVFDEWMALHDLITGEAAAPSASDVQEQKTSDHKRSKKAPKDQEDDSQSSDGDASDDQTVTDQQLLQAVSALAEKAGVEQAKEVVKDFAGDDGVQSIPQDKRKAFVAAVTKAMKGAAAETKAKDTAGTSKPATDRSRRRS